MFFSVRPLPLATSISPSIQVARVEGRRVLPRSCQCTISSASPPLHNLDHHRRHRLCLCRPCIIFIQVLASLYSHIIILIPNITNIAIELPLKCVLRRQSLKIFCLVIVLHAHHLLADSALCFTISRISSINNDNSAAQGLAGKLLGHFVGNQFW